MALLSILNKHVAVTVTDGDPAPEADEAARAARSTITGIGPPSFVDAFNAKKTGRWGVLEQSVEVQAMDEFEEERARAEKEEGDGDDEKDAKPMSKRSKAAAEKAKREAEEKERLEREAGNGAPAPYVPTIVKSEIPIPELSYRRGGRAVSRLRRRRRLAVGRVLHLHARARLFELRDGVERRGDRRGRVRGQRRARLGHEQGGPGRRGRVRDGPREPRAAFGEGRRAGRPRGGSRRTRRGRRDGGEGGGRSRISSRDGQKRRFFVGSRQTFARL